MSKVVQKIEEVSKTSLDEYGLSIKQFGTLTVIHEYANATQKEIGDIQRIDRTSIGQIIDQLQSKGYIIKSQNESNRKANVLELTEAGYKSIDLLCKRIETLESEVLSCLSDSDKHELLRILKKIIERMDN